MNLPKLFDIQKQLDDRIVKEHDLEGQNLLDKKILALQVELGELANEWRGFKFWSKDQESRTWEPNEKDICESCNGNPIFIENSKIIGQCEACDGCGVHFHNPLLEEYVDCLHFILSIGLELNMHMEDIDIDSGDYTTDEPSVTFNNMFSCVAEVDEIASTGARDDLVEIYEFTFNLFIGIGETHLSFGVYQIEQAYLEKNKVNHSRQEEGY